MTILNLNTQPLLHKLAVIAGHTIIALSQYSCQLVNILAILWLPSSVDLFLLMFVLKPSRMHDSHCLMQSLKELIHSYLTGLDLLQL